MPRNSCCVQHKTRPSLAVTGPEPHKQFWIKICVYVIINQLYFGVILGFGLLVAVSDSVLQVVDVDIL